MGQTWGPPLRPGPPTAVSLALRAVAHAGNTAAVVGSAFPITSSTTRQADALMLVATNYQSYSHLLCDCRFFRQRLMGIVGGIFQLSVP